MGKRTGLTTEEKHKVSVLKAEGLTDNAIGKEIGRDAKTVRRYSGTTEAKVKIGEAREGLAEFYKTMARRMLDSITADDISRINAYQRIVSSGICTDKARLLDGQSTDNIALHHELIAAIKGVKPVGEDPEK